jgi:hypothetical protein
MNGGQLTDDDGTAALQLNGQSAATIGWRDASRR